MNDIRIEPKLKEKLEAFGLADNNLCFNCGNCTAVCGLTERDLTFPRKGIRHLQLGMSEKVNQSVEPWLCYYCGDCSKTCPREANPAEQMMSLRRYLTSVYDWTGLSFKFYTSKLWELGALLFVGAIVLGLFGLYHATSAEPIIWDLRDGYVHLNSFAPVMYVHYADWVMAGILSFFLLSNLFNMYLTIMRSDKSLKIPLHLYFTKIFSIPLHFATQMRFKKCDNKIGFWFMHLFLMSGYGFMFILVLVLLPWFQIDQGINWTTYPGYYATFALLYGSIYCIIGRLRKKDEVHRYTHPSDWIFLIMLFLTTLTGIMVHVFRYYLLMPAATYYTYAIHLAIAVPMLVVEVPFSKWAHLAFRPFAMYFADIKKAALAIKK
ncbi:MAG: hypothetical protein A2583_06180 [Bdellovibrionales bacterium RIFOXYD1_FULL_53_11]|nr:MAG: hypothetical protein A2583_06180 [Bdellovibrionales bacterium RIFOXYD1_FULL_53_11]